MLVRIAGLIVVLMLLVSMFLFTSDTQGYDRTMTSTPPTPVPSELAGIVQYDEFGIPMVFVPDGEFMMGMDEEQAMQHCLERLGDAGEPDDCNHLVFSISAPAHLVTVESFWIDQYEVSQGDWIHCEEAGVCSYLERSERLWTEYDDSLPRTRVSFSSAHDYCIWRTARLPSEAEWEYAARGPDNLIYPWGNDFEPQNTNIADLSWANQYGHDVTDVNGRLLEVWWDDGYARQAPVGNFPNDLSWVNAYDMLGNVQEYVTDSPAAYPGTPSDSEVVQWISDLEPTVIYRGLNYGQGYDIASAYFRGLAWGMDSSTGFRCARAVDESMPIPDMPE